ncbi:hypothetical protein WJX73_010009 [Symbiochloris irregularis]|uniref:Electron transfer flavoprotein-ubiquinone oxidoreductase n=1 Tax=Symbiochloris irregularis TaxID=706552 RepID=A0AAW1PS72_9CHLO
MLYNRLFYGVHKRLKDLPVTQVRAFATTGLPSREIMEYDVCIVGAGPAGLSAAIRLKQKCQKSEKDLSVCVLEKGTQIGSHILSGNVLETRALDELLPDWKDQAAPVKTAATADRFYFLSETRAWRMPTPPQMHNKGNYVISLSQLVRWLGGKAEELGVEIFPGFPASEVLYSRGAVAGVATADMGIGKDGQHKDTFARGVEVRARATLFAEGCRGSLSQGVMQQYQLREQAGADPQTYALGIKEVWQVPPERHKPGTIWHTIGYPLQSDTYGGSFLYHMDDCQVALGFVVGLDYPNPHLSPYQEFQRWKAHPHISALLQGGSVVQYGARCLNEGGLQSVPRLTFPGGALIGCSAGFLNVPKIKGTHTAMKTGMLAADAAFDALTKSAASAAADLSAFETEVKASWVWQELQRCRNIRPGFAKAGLWGGLANAAVDTYLLRGQAPWTLHTRHKDNEATQPAASQPQIQYPAADNDITFPLATSLYKSGTTHNHDQPPHLRLRNSGIPSAVNLPLYAAPESRYCPAGVYEYVDGESGAKKLQINAQNCLHCKACDIKDPLQNIVWATPEGGGPEYTVM